MSANFSQSSTEQERRHAKSILDCIADKTVSDDVLIRRYDQKCDDYDEAMGVVNYNGPKETATTLVKLYPYNRENVNILDIAAGTGLCAIEFRKHGFQKMDAFDASEKMLNVSREKGLYGLYMCDMLGGNTLDIEDDTYDVVTICGMSIGIMRKLPMKAFEELIRVTKQGGYIINTGFYATFSDVNTLTEDFRRHIKTLESEGKWKYIEVRHFEDYLSGHDGGVSVQQVC